MYDIKFIPKEEMDSILPFLEWLNPKTEKELVAQRLQDLLKTDYQCVGVYHNSKLIAISGIWILNKIYAGKHIEPDNVMVHPDYQKNGIGEILMNWIHNYAKEIGCISSELNCYVKNPGGVRFWIRQGYNIVGYHFIKRLEN
jgi:GNAT superfamily N-acetyltransferase